MSAGMRIWDVADDETRDLSVQMAVLKAMEPLRELPLHPMCERVSGLVAAALAGALADADVPPGLGAEVKRAMFCRLQASWDARQRAAT